MPADASAKQSARDLSRRLPAYRGVLPSWFFSIWFHILVLVAAAFGLRSCTGSGQSGEADTEWKEVGLVMRMNDSPTESQSQSQETKPKPEESPSETSFEASELPEVESEPFTSTDTPLPSAMANDLPPVIGPGSAMPSFPEADEDSRATTGVSSTPIPPSGLARGETEFMGVRAKGQRIVYVIDVSGSMATPPTAIGSAKAELLGSLATLTAEQKFQVVFFNELASAMRIRGLRRGEWIAATDIHRTMARKEIAAVRPDLGTRAMPALVMALEMNPDVIFFLTDAKATGLSPRDLAEIGRLNDGEARIHAIEFGKGDRLNEHSRLERLAEQNGGAYQYHDVNQLGR